MKMRLPFIFAAAITMLGGSAQAATFVETFTATGSFAGSTFTDALITLTGTGTLPSQMVSPGIYQVGLTANSVSGTLDSGTPFSVSFTNPIVVFSNENVTAFGFEEAPIGDIADATATGVKDDLSSSFVAMGQYVAEADMYQTTGGYIYFHEGTGSTFTENVSAAGVPEPSSWMLMIAGVAIVGGTLRLGRKLGVNSPKAA